MELICGVLAITSIVLGYIALNKHYAFNELNESFRIADEKYDERLKHKNETIQKLSDELEESKKKKLDLKEKLDKEFNLNNEMKEEIASLQIEISELKAKNEKIRKLPKKLKSNAKREDKIQYTKDYLKANNIKFKEVNNTNALLTIEDTPFKIYAATQAFVNSETKVKSYGVLELVKQIKKIEKKGRNENENK